MRWRPETAAEGPDPAMATSRQALLASQRAREARAAHAPLDWLADRVILFRYGNFIFVSYGLFAALGGLLAMTWISVLLLGQGLSRTELAAMLLAGSVSILVFTRVAAIALDFRMLLRDPIRVLRSAAFTSWGGVIALLFTAALFSWLTGERVLLLLDAIACATPLAHAIGRIGCLTYGCCFGKPTGLPWSISYRNPNAKAVRVGGLHGVPLHPAPLYEAAWNAGLFALLNGLALGGAPQGVPAATYALLYGVGRLLIEFTRDNSQRLLWRWLAVNHVLSLLLMTGGTFFLAVVVQQGLSTPGVSLSTGVLRLATVSPLLLASAVVLFLGFSLQRNRVGEW
jgi:phosphatidylglycerol:prolipoprotein diacylglycerol transferase